MFFPFIVGLIQEITGKVIGNNHFLLVFHTDSRSLPYLGARATEEMLKVQRSPALWIASPSSAAFPFLSVFIQKLSIKKDSKDNLR